ncbi:MAG: hypothetical protein E6J90_37090 [Deltaproteobacteria bacterium]|nr:MAG: hypothetical protein E6J90_37090 [Deltaproteobacteria bacterium]
MFHPQLSDPITLSLPCPATLLHATAHTQEPGHILEAGWVLREELREDIQRLREDFGLPPSQTTIVQYAHDGLVGRYEVRVSDLEAAMQVLP